MTGTVVDALASSLASAATYNRGDKAPPVAVLWPDPDRAWTSVIEALRGRLPILTLGDFVEADNSGPGIWIRCVFGGGLDVQRPSEMPWIVWLPGVARDDLRAVDNAPAHLRSLAELQYRADWWNQRDRSAWTPSSWLRSQDGLGIDLARDHGTREALGLAFGEVLNLGVEELRRRGRIDAGYLTSLVSRDEVRTLLRWLDDPEATQKGLPEAEWQAFQAQCRKEFNVDLAKDGQLTVAERLGNAEGPWDRAWQRYEEAPGQYPNLPNVLRSAKAQLVMDPRHWPQDNDDAEDSLRKALSGLKEQQPSVVRERIGRLEAEHGERRDSVWGRQGQSPLAVSLGYLAELAKETAALPHHDSVDGYAGWYAAAGHRTDSAAVAALAQVRGADLDAVGIVVRALYFGWLDDTTRRFQDAVAAGGYVPTMGLTLEDGDCAVFVDGLRYDVGEALRLALVARGIAANIEHRLAPLPSVTSTGKAAVTPLATELGAGDEFDLRLDGKAFSLKRDLARRGVSILAEGEVSAETRKGWTETANIDKAGHSLKLDVAERLEGQVKDIASRVEQLLDAGWKRAMVVTDHGWLLMPGTLNKQELTEARTVVRKPRAARLKAGAEDDGYPSVLYVYDTSVRIVSPRGIAAFEAGCTYEHGGLSLQECVIPTITAMKGDPGPTSGRIVDVSWIGLRCRVTVAAAPGGALVDLRRSPGAPDSSIAMTAKAVEGADEGALLVPDDSLDGQGAYAVLLSDQGAILSQMSTRVGG